ncbi:MAG: HAMP domain-containing histidine kinase [Chloroflexi bacterium]|nr:HAMP domain-containing histidine kinase [Chloroflexota bacterium]
MATTPQNIMNQAYSQELRVDTSRILIPVITFVTTVMSFIFTLHSAEFLEIWYYWLIVILGPLSSLVAWKLFQKEQEFQGAAVFLSAQYIVLSVILFQEWQVGSALPYLFGIMIVASTMFYRVETGFIAWAVSVLISVAVVFYHDGISWPSFLTILPAILINFGLAGVAFLSAMEWQYAVETVSDLHVNVRRRRDDLYQVQKEVKWANAQLESSNHDLDIARQQALDERDIRTRFMNHVSHELRTPLNAIVNFAHILRLGSRGPVVMEQIDYLQRIEQSGWHLLSVLNDLLDMAQIQAGEFKLHREVTNLHDICEEAMSSTRGLLLDGEVDLVRDYPKEWPLVYVDKMRIKQALINLLGNGVKYTEEGFITMRVRPSTDFVTITIEDTGIGIPADHYQSIFKEFHQVNESHARRRTGTGLGLPITRHLVQRHGGDISMESEVGRGSHFTITLPVVTADQVVQDDSGIMHLKPPNAADIVTV